MGLGLGVSVEVFGDCVEDRGRERSTSRKQAQPKGKQKQASGTTDLK
jgi:hypothetical protein